MSVYIPVSLRNQIRELDRDRCSYRQTRETLSGIPLTFDHIYPISKGGVTSLKNVCLACRSCNEFKGYSVTGQDLLTQEIVSLFNPRTQKWQDHFYWSNDGTKVEGKTSVGRVTVLALQMNHKAIVTARRRWVSVGWHPPVE